MCVTTVQRMPIHDLLIANTPLPLPRLRQLDHFRAPGWLDEAFYTVVAEDLWSYVPVKGGVSLHSSCPRARGTYSTRPIFPGRSRFSATFNHDWRAFLGTVVFHASLNSSFGPPRRSISSSHVSCT